MATSNSLKPFNVSVTGRTYEESESIIRSLLAQEPSNISRQAVYDMICHDNSSSHRQSRLAAFVYANAVDDTQMRSVAQNIMIERILELGIDRNYLTTSRFDYAIWTASDLPQNSPFREHVIAMAYDALPESPFEKIDACITLYREAGNDSPIKSLAETTVIDTLDRNISMAEDRYEINSYYHFVRHVIDQAPVDTNMHRHALTIESALKASDAYKEWKKDFLSPTPRLNF